MSTGVAASVASTAVREELRSSLSIDHITIGFGGVEFNRLPDADASEFDADEGVKVTWPAQVDVDAPATTFDDLVDAPATTFDDLVDASPRSVTVTLDVDGHEYTAVVPVVCVIRARKRY
ncbi:hypothetical protein [Halopiger goleimassiliensis]|uniref:hypothetical protein n=1 Tax=Halopiger goleimassiliensis TaxID=1293048 RepID=UPI0012B65653|nr:hypothetical protein [Halopiger goleimassiliensis]